MIINFPDLNPLEGTVKIHGKTYELTTFNLKVQLWVMENFKTEGNKDGWKNYHEIISNVDNPAYIFTILETIHKLLKDKSDFPCVEDLRDSFERERDLFIHLGVFLQAIATAIGVSQPDIEKIQEDKDRKKQVAKVA